MTAFQCEEDWLKAKDTLTAEEKRKLRFVAYLKYVNVSHRSAAYDSRKRAIRTFLERASPGKLAKMLLADGALVALTGARCTAAWRTRVASKKQHTSITKDSVFYRCLTCLRDLQKK